MPTGSRPRRPTFHERLAAGLPAASRTAFSRRCVVIDAGPRTSDRVEEAVLEGHSGGACRGFAAERRARMSRETDDFVEPDQLAGSATSARAGRRSSGTRRASGLRRRDLRRAPAPRLADRRPARASARRRWPIGWRGGSCHQGPIRIDRLRTSRCRPAHRCCPAGRGAFPSRPRGPAARHAGIGSARAPQARSRSTPCAARARGVRLDRRRRRLPHLHRRQRGRLQPFRAPTRSSRSSRNRPRELAVPDRQPRAPAAAADDPLPLPATSAAPPSRRGRAPPSTALGPPWSTAPDGCRCDRRSRSAKARCAGRSNPRCPTSMTFIAGSPGSSTRCRAYDAEADPDDSRRACRAATPRRISSSALDTLQRWVARAPARICASGRLTPCASRGGM